MEITIRNCIFAANMELKTNNMLLEYQNQKIKEVLLYVLSKTGDIGYFRLMKTIFCADRQNLMKWGDQVTSLEYFARKHGPVPSAIYSELLSIYHGNASTYSDIVSVKGNFLVHANRQPNLDYLSETDKESIDKAIAELDGKNRNQIEDYLHEKVYKQVFAKKSQHYSLEDIAKSGGASKKVIENIKEQVKLLKALS